MTTDDRNQVIRVETNGRTVRNGVPAEFQTRERAPFGAEAEEEEKEKVRMRKAGFGWPLFFLLGRAFFSLALQKVFVIV